MKMTEAIWLGYISAKNLFGNCTISQIRLKVNEINKKYGKVHTFYYNNDNDYGLIFKTDDIITKQMVGINFGKFNIDLNIPRARHKVLHRGVPIIGGRNGTEYDYWIPKVDGGRYKVKNSSESFQAHPHVYRHTHQDSKEEMSLCLGEATIPYSTHAVNNDISEMARVCIEVLTEASKHYGYHGTMGYVVSKCVDCGTYVEEHNSDEHKLIHKEYERQYAEKKLNFRVLSFFLKKRCANCLSIHNARQKKLAETEAIKKAKENKIKAAKAKREIKGHMASKNQKSQDYFMSKIMEDILRRKKIQQIEQRRN